MNRVVSIEQMIDLIGKKQSDVISFLGPPNKSENIIPNFTIRYIDKTESLSIILLQGIVKQIIARYNINAKLQLKGKLLQRKLELNKLGLPVKSNLNSIVSETKGCKIKINAESNLITKKYELIIIIQSISNKFL
jgi:hypothetical protein